VRYVESCSEVEVANLDVVPMDLSTLADFSIWSL
jgi:hypothetical protein